MRGMRQDGVVPDYATTNEPTDAEEQQQRGGAAAGPSCSGSSTAATSGEEKRQESVDDWKAEKVPERHASTPVERPAAVA